MTIRPEIQSLPRYKPAVKGKKQLVAYGSATTNDIGEFRLFALPPGDYVVMVPSGTSTTPLCEDGIWRRETILPPRNTSK